MKPTKKHLPKHIARRADRLLLDLEKQIRQTHECTHIAHTEALVKSRQSAFHRANIDDARQQCRICAAPRSVSLTRWNGWRMPPVSHIIRTNRLTQQNLRQNENALTA